jgi:hypothetical protein
MLRKHGAEPQATTVETLAEELDAFVADWSDEPLDLQQAAAESGYSAEHLGRLVRDGKIPSAGRLNVPAIRRRDLPTKPGYLPQAVSELHLPREVPQQIARSIVDSIQ